MASCGQYGCACRKVSYSRNRQKAGNADNTQKQSQTNADTEVAIENLLYLRFFAIHPRSSALPLLIVLIRIGT